MQICTLLFIIEVVIVVVRVLHKKPNINLCSPPHSLIRKLKLNTNSKQIATVPLTELSAN